MVHLIIASDAVSIKNACTDDAATLILRTCTTRSSEPGQIISFSSSIKSNRKRQWGLFDKHKEIHRLPGSLRFRLLPSAAPPTIFFLFFFPVRSVPWGGEEMSDWK